MISSNSERKGFAPKDQLLKARTCFLGVELGRVAQSVGHLTRKSEVLGSIPGLPHTFVSPSADSRGAVVSYWRKYVQEVLVNSLGGLRLPRKSVVRLTDCPDMTVDVYRGCKTTKQQQQILGVDPIWKSYIAQGSKQKVTKVVPL